MACLLFMTFVAVPKRLFSCNPYLMLALFHTLSADTENKSRFSAALETSAHFDLSLFQTIVISSNQRCPEQRSVFLYMLFLSAVSVLRSWLMSKES